MQPPQTTMPVGLSARLSVRMDTKRKRSRNIGPSTARYTQHDIIIRVYIMYLHTIPIYTRVRVCVSVSFTTLQSQVMCVCVCVCDSTQWAVTASGRADDAR